MSDVFENSQRPRENLSYQKAKPYLRDMARGFFYFKLLPQELLNMLAQKETGIVEIGAGDAGLAPGLRTLLLEQFQYDIPILCTDIYPYNKNSPTAAMLIDEYVAANPTASHKISYGETKTGLIFSQSFWKSIRQSLTENGGAYWDGTSTDFYNKALTKLTARNPQIKKAALMIRQPEISDDEQSSVFNQIINNMVKCVIQYDVPAIIITSSKVKSVDRAFSGITDSLASLGYSLPQENLARKVENYESDAQTTYSYSNPNRHRIDFIDAATRLCAKRVETNRDNSDCYGRKYMQDFIAYLLIPSSKLPRPT